MESLHVGWESISFSEYIRSVHSYTNIRTTTNSEEQELKKNYKITKLKNDIKEKTIYKLSC